MDLDNGRIVNFEVFFDQSRILLMSVNAYDVVDYVSAKISFLSKLDLDDGRSSRTICDAIRRIIA